MVVFKSLLLEFALNAVNVHLLIYVYYQIFKAKIVIFLNINQKLQCQEGINQIIKWIF